MFSNYLLSKQLYFLGVQVIYTIIAMRVLYILFICLSLLTPSLLVSAEIGNVKKITILESNNERLDDRFQTLILPSSLQDSTMIALRKFVSTSLTIKNLSDPEVFFQSNGVG